MSKQRKELGLPIINAHATGVDVGARIHAAAVPPDLCQTPVQTFQAFTSDIERMPDWLVSLGKTVPMESNGVHWIPVYEILEDRGLVIVLANARECKAVPGRKSDVNDAQWCNAFTPAACCTPASARRATLRCCARTCGFEIGI